MIRKRLLSAWFLFLLAAPCAVYAQTPQRVNQQQLPPGFVPQSFEALGRRAAFHTDFTFDRSMLQFAGNFIGGDQQTRDAIGKLDSISVHSYHFAAPGLYDPRVLNGVRQQYEAAGWKHLVAAHAKGDPFDPKQTDLWINFAHMDVTGMMILITGSRDLNLIALNGDLSTVDLLHLRGHFGIPRFSGDGFAPPPRGGAREPYVAPPAEQAPPEQAPQQYPSEGVGQGIGVSGDGAEVEAAPPPPTPPGF